MKLRNVLEMSCSPRSGESSFIPTPDAQPLVGRSICRPGWVAFLLPGLRFLARCGAVLKAGPPQAARCACSALCWLSPCSTTPSPSASSPGASAPCRPHPAILNAITPIWALLLGLAAGNARATRLTAAGVALGFLGVLGVVFGHSSAIASGAGTAGFLSWNDLSLLSASFSYGAGAVAAKRWLHGVEPVVIATFQLTLAGLVLLPLALFGPHPTALHWKSVAAVTVLGVLGSGLAYLLFFRLLATISPTRTVAVTYLLPIWGLFWGFIAGEQIHWTALAGVAVVLGRTCSPESPFPPGEGGRRRDSFSRALPGRASIRTQKGPRPQEGAGLFAALLQSRSDYVPGISGPADFLLIWMRLFFV